MVSGAGTLVDPVVALAARLRTRDVSVGPGRVESAVRALDAVDARSIDDAYWATRCCLISRYEDIEAFDEAFAEFWGGRNSPGMNIERPMPAGNSTAEAPVTGEGSTQSVLGPDSDQPGDDEGSGDEASDSIGTRFSTIERLRSMEFKDWSREDLAEAQGYLERIARDLPMKTSRRMRSAHRGRTIDRRATMRRAMRTEGHPLELLARERREKPRKLCFVIDVSGSMESYARPLIAFSQAVSRVSNDVEVFSLGTRLTRLTSFLGERDPTVALERATAAVPDWAGGTRIGENLRTLNSDWGRRGATRGAVVVIYSDGWERGGVDVLADEMARLKRNSHSIVWVNPLAGEFGYQPLAAGMAAAMPHIDAFLPGHDLGSLEAVVETIGSFG